MSLSADSHWVEKIRFSHIFILGFINWCTSFVAKLLFHIVGTLLTHVVHLFLLVMILISTLSRNQNSRSDKGSHCHRRLIKSDRKCHSYFEWRINSNNYRVALSDEYFQGCLQIFTTFLFMTHTRVAGALWVMKSGLSEESFEKL